MDVFPPWGQATPPPAPGSPPAPPASALTASRPREWGALCRGLRAGLPEPGSPKAAESLEESSSLGQRGRPPGSRTAGALQGRSAGLAERESRPSFSPGREQHPGQQRPAVLPKDTESGP